MKVKKISQSAQGNPMKLLKRNKSDDKAIQSTSNSNHPSLKKYKLAQLFLFLSSIFDPMRSRSSASKEIMQD
jgi:hypothetical protein